MSTYCIGVSPGARNNSLSWSLYFKICLWDCCDGMHIRRPNHWRRFILNCMVSHRWLSPHSSSTSALRCLSHREKPRISLKHCIWNIESFQMSISVTGHFSVPQTHTHTICHKSSHSLSHCYFRCLQSLLNSLPTSMFIPSYCNSIPSFLNIGCQ